jgi:hypothetical protein
MGTFYFQVKGSSNKLEEGNSKELVDSSLDELAYLIQNFITCEGRFSIIYLYHIKLLQHLKADCEINMPYFLLQSLSKMAKAVQKQGRNSEKSLYHCGFIKMIIIYELQKQNLT